MKIFLLLSFVITIKLTFAGPQTNCGKWDPYNDEKCYKVIENLKSFDDAKTECFDLDDSSLVTIRSQQEQDSLFYLLNNTYKLVDNVWIGIEFSVNGYYKWSDSTVIDYFNWANGNPVNESGYDCVQLDLNQPFNGQWFNKPCNKKNYFVCEKTQKWQCLYLQETVLELRYNLSNTRIELEKTITELYDTKTELINTNQEIIDIKEKLNNSNVCFFGEEWVDCKVFIDYHTNNRQNIAIPKRFDEKIATWPNSASICNKYNASLISIKSLEKQKFIETYTQLNNTSIWTSGSKDLSGNYSWSDGSKLSYTNWAARQPDNFNGVENCLMLNGHDPEFHVWSWNDVRCDFSYFVICEF